MEALLLSSSSFGFVLSDETWFVLGFGLPPVMFWVPNELECQGLVNAGPRWRLSFFWCAVFAEKGLGRAATVVRVCDEKRSAVKVAN